MTTFFYGCSLCEVDATGAVRIPKFLADALGADVAALLVAWHEADECLIAYGRELLPVLWARVEERRRQDDARGAEARAHYHRLRRTFGLVEPMPCDGETLRIPAAMRHLSGIGELALFVGAGDIFEIWNPDLAAEHEDEQFRDLAAFRLRGCDCRDDPQGVH